MGSGAAHMPMLCLTGSGQRYLTPARPCIWQQPARRVQPSAHNQMFQVRQGQQAPPVQACSCEGALVPPASGAQPERPVDVC